MTIAIIGAGMAGLSCAEALSAAGMDVRLYDKGRGPGGRMSTRRAETSLGQLRWDHGAQYFTARDAGFANAVADWVSAGAAAEWTGRFAEIDADGAVSPAEAKARYVGAPSMNAVIRHLAAPLDVSWGRRVSEIERTGDAWQLHFEDGSQEGPFETVISAIPAEQAAELLERPAPQLANDAAGVTSAPCWAVMLAFAEPIAAKFDAAKISGNPVAWAARNVSKPGRDAGETWVLHGAADWSRAHLEDDNERVAEALAQAFAEIGGASAPVFKAAHRWRYSQVEAGAGSSFGWRNAARIGAIGDWRTGPRIENAWLSGQAMAQHIIEHIITE